MIRKLAIVGVIVAAVWIWWASKPADATAVRTRVVVVEQGMSLGDIAALLSTQELIRSPFMFRVRAWFSGSAGSLKAGAYEFSASMRLSEIIDVLRRGRVHEVRVTIPEGLTLRELDALMASKGLGAPGDLLDCARRCDFSTFDFLPSAAATDDPSVGSRLEGYLFPETYAVSPTEYHPKFFLERMLGTFRARVISPYAREIEQGDHSLRELVIMASLIEEEAARDDERTMIAGILWKRLDAGIVLGVDATTRYELRKQREPLTKADLEARTPYNTRRQRGLPPSPIANPGERSLVAALRPQSSRYWYYLHGADGVIRYAETDAEHIANKRKYL